MAVSPAAGRDPGPTARAGGIASEIRAALRAAADPVRAVGQQAYMKSAMPFWGVPLPEVRRLVRTRLLDLSAAETLALAADLFDGAERREERYAGLAALAAPTLRGQPTVVPLIERFVLEGRWWDITDELSHRVAELHDAEPERARATVLAWSVDHRDEPVEGAGMWLRRLAIISQLGRRDRVDLALLAAVIEPNIADPDFFIRKAIGWSLREVARVRPDWVVAFVNTHALSPLSRREALKHLV